jgi:lysophospholipase L1-like esterase
MRTALARGVVAIALTATLASCSKNDVILPPKTSLNTGLFRSYVALGNSITSGYQSGGILDSTQRESYAFLLAQQAGTRYAYASLAGRGCPPPIVNFQTGARYGGGSATTCDLRQSYSAVLNNVAVPGAAAIDPTDPTSANSNVLTTLILGGLTQVQKALEAAPSFVSIWIGNNDVLPAALSGVVVPVAGVSPGVTPVPTFIAEYDTMMTQLTAGAPGLKGVLIGVVDVTLIPSLFPIDSILADPVLNATVNAVAGHTITYNGDCTGAHALLSIEVLPLIAAGTFPPEIGCSDEDAFTLDADKIALITGTVDAYNAFIEAKADSLGFAYVDPNALLGPLKAAGAIPTIPNFASATLPFGNFITLDGVHPSATAHIAVANALITAINAQYSVSIPAVPTP